MSADAGKQRAIDTHSAQADEFAASYRDAETDPYRTCFAYSRRRLGLLLDRLLPNPASHPRLLDVGCGTGHHLAALRARGFAVAGVDGSEAMLAHARRGNPGVDLRQADVDALPFADASQDVVLSIEVLRYLADPSRALGEMARVLRRGGVGLLTATPLLNANGYFLVNRLARFLPARNLVQLRQYFTTSGGLRRRLREAGFDDVDVHGVYLGPVNWVERLAPRALPRVLRSWERADAALADRPVLRELANMFLVRATR